MSERRWWVALTGAATVLLLIGCALGVGTASGHRNRLDEIRGQREAQARAQAAERERRTAELREADPEALLTEVVERNADFSHAVTHWDDHGRPASELSTIQQAQSACMAAIVAYDVVAARYADLLPPGLPEQIDLDEESWNCSAEDFRTGGLQM
jgi:hypothetical protein